MNQNSLGNREQLVKCSRCSEQKNTSFVPCSQPLSSFSSLGNKKQLAVFPVPNREQKILYIYIHGVCVPKSHTPRYKNIQQAAVRRRTK